MLSDDCGVRICVLEYRNILQTAICGLRQLPSSGHFRVSLRAVDAAGNVGDRTAFELYVDMTPPATPPSILSGPSAQSALGSAQFQLQLPTADTSPGGVTFFYSLYRDAVLVRNDVRVAPDPSPSTAIVDLTLTSTSYCLGMPTPSPSFVAIR